MDDLENAVAKFLKRRGTVYVQFLEEVLSALGRYKDTGSRSNCIYRIYSRADKQKGRRPLKSEAGIVATLQRWKQENPSVRIEDLHDIIGATIVTYFDSEVPLIVDAIKVPNVFGPCTIKKEWKKEGDGYYASHLAVAKEIGVITYLCEIQVKSLLNDGWAAKTHDLVYKNPAVIDPEVSKQIKLIGTLINVLEKQSDSLRNVITRGQEIDTERREAAISQLLKATITGLGQTKEQDAIDWCKKLLDSRGHCAQCDEKDPVLVSLVSEWKGIRKRVGPSRLVSRLITLLAVTRPRSFDVDAFDTIDDWIKSIAEPKPLHSALLFKGMAHWALGDYDEAIATCERVVRAGVLDGHALLSARMDLAYYLAEKAFIREGKCPDEIRKTLDELLRGWEDEPDERRRMSRQDSAGAIKIMTAATTDEVFEGHRLCAGAYDWAKSHNDDANIFEVFFKLHTERARRRIRELENV